MKLVWNKNHIRAVHEDSQILFNHYPLDNIILQTTEMPVFENGFNLADSNLQPTSFKSQTGLSFIGGQWIIELSSVKQDAVKKVEYFSGETRERFATSSPLQDTVYRLKQTHAQSYADIGYTGNIPSLIESESLAQGISYEEATNFILTTADTWIEVVAAVEYIRQKTKKRISNAGQTSEVMTHLTKAYDDLAKIGA